MFKLATPLSLLFAAVATLLVGLMPVLGTRLPDRAPWIETGFSACDLPCWSNITPGKTSFRDVVPLLVRSLPLTQDTRLLDSSVQVSFWTTAEGQTFSGYLDYAYGKVGNLHLYIALPAGQLVRRLGAPICVYAESGAGEEALVLYWETDGISTAALFSMQADGTWDMTRVSSSIWVSITSMPCLHDRALPWIGFAPYWRYQRSIGFVHAG